MILLLLVLLQTAPIITETASQAMPGEGAVGIQVSRTGKFVLLFQPNRICIRDSVSLASVKDLDLRYTAIGFDATDTALLIVGDKVVRYDTNDWEPTTLGVLEDARFSEREQDNPKTLLAQQAFVTPNLDFYYCSANGDIALASIENGKLKSHPMALKGDPNLDPPRRILEHSDTAFLIVLGKALPGIVLRDTFFFLPECHGVLAASAIGDVAVCVGLDREAIYSTRTWKTLDSRVDVKNTCVAMDKKSGWVFVGDREGLRGWSIETFRSPVRFPQWKKPVTAVGLFAEKQILYTISEGILRRSTLTK